MRFCDSSSAILVGVWPRFRLNASQNATKTRPKRDQNVRCNIANASWVSRFGMLEARVLLAFRVISLAFSQNANQTHGVIRALIGKVYSPNLNPCLAWTSYGLGLLLLIHCLIVYLAI